MRKSILILLFFLVLNSMLLSATDGIYLSGTVYDSTAGTQKPLAGAAVYVKDASNVIYAASDNSGNYRLFITSAFMAKTQFILGAQCPAYTASETTVTPADLTAQPNRGFALALSATPLPTPTRDITRTATPTCPCAIVFSGKVVDRDTRQPLQGAIVKLEYYAVQKVTDSAGAYLMSFVYTYNRMTRVSMTGYRDLLLIAPANIQYVDFQLAAATATPTPTPTPTPTTQPVNLALNRPASASSSQGSGYAPNRAFDGKTTTRWSSASSDPQWIRVDLGSNYDIAKVVLRWEAAYAKSYQVQVSPDGAAWTTVYSTTAGTGGVSTLAVSGSGRYVRMNGTARKISYGYSLWEFEVYGTAGNTPTPVPPTPTLTPLPTPAVTATPAPSASLVITYKDPGYSETGTWTTHVTNAGRKSVAIGSTATWTGTIPSTGYYNVFVIYPVDIDATGGKAQYTVSWNTTAYVFQQLPVGSSGQFQITANYGDPLSAYTAFSFLQGSTVTVTLTVLSAVETTAGSVQFVPAHPPAE
jgi:hypothetical protein